MSLLLAALVATTLALYLSRGGRAAVEPSNRLALGGAYLPPAVFLLLALWLAPPEAHRFRMALLGFGIRGDAVAELRVPIGGDRSDDSIWVAGFGDSAGGGTELGELIFEPPRAGDETRGTMSLSVPAEVSAGVLVVRPAGSSFEPIPSTRLEHDDVIEIGGEEWRVVFEGQRQSLVPLAGDAIDIPQRRGKLPLLELPIRIRRPFSIGQRTFSLGSIGTGAGGSPVRSFLFRKPGEGLWLTRLEAVVHLLRDGVEIDFETRSSLPEGVRIHAVGLPRPHGGWPAGGLRDRRSFRVTTGSRSVMLTLDTPEVHSLTEREMRQLIDTGSGSEEILRLNLAMGDWRITDRYLHFRHASNQIASEAFGTLELAPSSLPGFGGRRVLQLMSPHGQHQLEESQPFWLGRTHLAAIQFDFLSPPLALAVLGLLLAWFKGIAAGAAKLSRTQILFATALEVLVAVRLLLAYRVWAMTPYAQEPYELALVAWALLPWAFLTVSLPPLRKLEREDAEAWLPTVAGSLFAVAWCAQVSGGGLKTLVWISAMALAFTVPILRSEAFWRLGPLMASSTRTASLSDRQWLGLWCGGALLLCALRVVLLLVGFRESLMVGGSRFSLSLVHVPLALALEAGYLVWLWHTMIDHGQPRVWDFLPAAVIPTVGWLVPSLVVSDLGLVLLHLPVFLLALTSVSLAARRVTGFESWGWWAPLAVLTACVLLIGFSGFARILLSPLPEGVHLRLSSERNYLRFLAFAYPSQLSEIGRRTSEELNVMSTVMRTYTAGEHAFLGRGYFGSEISPHIRATALREHVPSVFIAAEWGLAGILGLILVYLLAAVAGSDLPPWRKWYREELSRVSGTQEFWAALGCLAALTLALPSIYMILANYGVLLFTGRNTYLMGLDSTADLLETLTLSLLFGFGAATVRDEGTDL